MMMLERHNVAHMQISQRRSRISLLVALAFFLHGAAAISQEADAGSQDSANNDDESEAIEQIIVTGSRIRRDAFTSPSPIQVLDAEVNIRMGVSSVTEMLQRSPLAIGQQVDGSINTATGSGAATFPDGGVGSANINLRGLGPERTLVMVNSKRLGSAGVRGAPVQPDLSLIPLGMVESIDILTGGQSTIYGADAVAGVVNMNLKKDFDGLEFFGSANVPEDGGGEQYRTSAIWGRSGDDSNFTIGIEYSKRESLRTEERDFSQCYRQIEIAEDGQAFSACDANPDNIITLRGGILPQLPPGAPFPASPTGTITAADATRPRYIPGLSAADSDIGIENFGTAFNLPQTPAGLLPIPGPGAPFAVFRGFYADFWNTQDERRQADMIQGEERFSVVANGRLELNSESSSGLYFEGYYFNRQNEVNDMNAQLVFEIPSGIPQEDANGNIITDVDNNPVLVDNPISPFPFAPELGAATSAEIIVTLDDLPTLFDVEVEQFRGVIGMDGLIPIEWFNARDWTYDVFVAYDRGTGFQSQPSIAEPNLIAATQFVRLGADGNLKCGVGDLPANFGGFLTPEACVPLNAFATSIFEDGEGRFSSDAERDYLLTTRVNRTVTEQVNSAAIVTGDLFELPWAGGGMVAMAGGAEWRLDRIDSSNDFLGTRGSVAASNPSQEGDTKGSRWIYDFFAEFSVPLLTDRPFANLLQFDGAARYTEEENFGSEVTWRIAGVYRPVEFLTFSGARNTSFRAPNLREQFLANQRGTISQGADPCANTNVIQFPEGPQKDILLQNCAAAGVDVDVLGIRGLSSIEVNLGGAGDTLEPETSESTTFSVQVDQPWYEGFDLSVALTYWDIDISNTVRELDPSTIINRCYFDSPGLTSPFCALVEREMVADPADELIGFVDASFVNIGEETANGFDVNARLAFEAGSFRGRGLNVAVSVGATHLLEQTRRIFPDSPEIDNAGRFGNPEWVSNTTVAVIWDRYELLWQTRFIDETRFDDDIIDPGASNPFRTSSLFDTAKLTRLDDIAEDRFYNDLSLTARISDVTLTAGIRNLFDEDPPLIDQTVGPNRNNAVTSSGFDLYGRTFFLNATLHGGL